MRKLFMAAIVAAFSTALSSQAVTWEVTYPAGGSASSVDDVQIKCTEVAYRYLADDATATLYDASDNVVRNIMRDDITLSFKGSYCTVDFEFNPAITEVGEYHIDVPANIFTTNESVGNEAFTVNFSVEASSYTTVNATFTCISPEGGKATSLEHILLASDGYTWDAVGASPSGTIYDAAFQPLVSLNGENIFAYKGNVMVALSTPITTPGTYALVLDEGAVVNTTTNVTNAQAMVELTVEAPPIDGNWEITYPAGGSASSVNDVQIKSSGAAFRYTAEDATATLYDASDNVVKTLVRDDITLSFKGDYCTVDFEFNPAITDVGEYHISVPEGTFTTTDGGRNAAFTVNFSVAASSYTTVDATFSCISPEGGKATSLEHILLASDGYTWDAVGASPSGTIYDAAFQPLVSLNGENIFAYKGNVMVALSTPITTPGSYALVLDEGAVVNTTTNVTNAQAMVELTVEAPAPEYTVTAMPENNSSVSATDGIQMIYLLVDGYKFVAANTSDITATITKNGEAYATLSPSVLSKGMDNASLIITLPEAAQLKTAGTYVISLPEGFFTMKSASDSEAAAVNSPAIELTYTITVPTEPLSWTISPEPGEVDKIERVTITFNKAVKIATTNNVFLFYSNSSYFPETVTDGYITLSDDGLVANLDFSPVFTDGGIFQIRLYEGSEQLSVVDGETFPGINITYKVNGPIYTECTPEAGSDVDSLDEVKIKLPRNTGIQESEFEATFTQGETVVNATLTKLKEYDYGDPSYIIVKPEQTITNKGEVTLKINAGSLIISNYGETMPSPEITLNFNVLGSSGIYELNAVSEGTADIYTPQGICLKRNAGAEDVQALSPGLYIVGGRKVVVK